MKILMFYNSDVCQRLRQIGALFSIKLIAAVIGFLTIALIAKRLGVAHRGAIVSVTANAGFWLLFYFSVQQVLLIPRGESKRLIETIWGLSLIVLIIQLLVAGLIDFFENKSGFNILTALLGYQLFYYSLSYNISQLSGKVFQYYVAVVIGKSAQLIFVAICFKTDIKTFLWLYCAVGWLGIGYDCVSNPSCSLRCINLRSVNFQIIRWGLEFFLSSVMLFITSDYINIITAQKFDHTILGVFDIYYQIISFFILPIQGFSVYLSSILLQGQMNLRSVLTLAYQYGVPFLIFGSVLIWLACFYLNDIFSVPIPENFVRFRLIALFCFSSVASVIGPIIVSSGNLRFTTISNIMSALVGLTALQAIEGHYIFFDARLIFVSVLCGSQMVSIVLICKRKNKTPC